MSSGFLLFMHNFSLQISEEPYNLWNPLLCRKSSVDLEEQTSADKETSMWVLKDDFLQAMDLNNNMRIDKIKHKQ